MFVSSRILCLLGFFAWGVAFFSVASLPGVKYEAVMELCDCTPFSAEVFLLGHAVSHVVFLGLAVGFVLFGIPADKFGRYRVLLWALRLTPLLAGLTGLALGFWDYLFLRFLVGFFSSGLILTGTILLFESAKEHELTGALLVAASGALAGLAAAIGLELFLDRFSGGQAIASWRLFFMLQAVPLVLLPFYRYFYDEPMHWKVAVRDAGDQRTKAGAVRTLWSKGKLGLLLGMLLTCSLFAGVDGVLAVYRDVFFAAAPEETTLSQAVRNQHSDLPTQPAALVTHLMRYPPLLERLRPVGKTEKGEKSAKELFANNAKPLPSDSSTETVDLSHFPEVWFGPLYPQGMLPAVLLEAMLQLDKADKAIHEHSILDKALERWNARFHEGRAAQEIPLSEIERFREEVRVLTDLGETVLGPDISVQSNGRIGGVQLWSARMELLKQLVPANDSDILERFNRYRGRIIRRDGFFVIGAGLGLCLLWRNRTFLDRKRSLPFFCLAMFLLAALMGTWSRGHAITTEWETMLVQDIFMFLFGAFLLALVVDLSLILPNLFPTEVRAMGLGFCLGIACCWTWILRGFVPHFGVAPWFIILVSFAVGIGVSGFLAGRHYQCPREQ